VPGTSGRFLADAQRQTVESRLDVDGLARLAELGKGLFLRADYRGDDTRKILDRASARGAADPADGAQAEVWNERYFLLLIPAMLALLPGFRRNRHRGPEVVE